MLAQTWLLLGKTSSLHQKQLDAGPPQNSISYKRFLLAHLRQQNTLNCASFKANISVFKFCSWAFFVCSDQQDGKPNDFPTPKELIETPRSSEALSSSAWIFGRETFPRKKWSTKRLHPMGIYIYIHILLALGVYNTYIWQ